jgi:indolepyruvate ferredoxin oxidoreductase, beta subunit
MSQRGGSVVSHIRYGEKVFSLHYPGGEADVLLGFELLETYRYLPLVVGMERFWSTT